MKALLKNQCHLHQGLLLMMTTVPPKPLSCSKPLTIPHRLKWHQHLLHLKDPKRKCIAFRWKDKQQQATHRPRLLHSQCSTFQWSSSNRNLLMSSLIRSLEPVSQKVTRRDKILSSFVLSLLLHLQFKTIHHYNCSKEVLFNQVTLPNQTHHQRNHLDKVFKQQ